MQKAEIIWTDIKGNITTVSTEEEGTFADVANETVKTAKSLGWHNPRWYEFWRRNDTKIG